MNVAVREKTPVYKRVLAICGIVVLVGMYIVLLFEAMTGSPDTFNVFIGCAAATVGVPIVLWLLIWAIGALTGRHTIASLDSMTSNKMHDKFGNVVPEGEIDTVVFDIGNVLTDFGWENFLRNKGFDEAMVQRIGDATTRSEDWSEFDRGVLSTEQIIDRFVENDPEIEKEIRFAFSDLSGLLVERERSIPWIRALKAAGYKVLVLSNYSKQAEDACPEAITFLSEVDGGILSYKDKVIKPDPAIYKLLMERYNLTAEKTVFIDDTEKNIIAARELGWKGIVFKSYDQVEKELRDLGVRY